MYHASTELEVVVYVTLNVDLSGTAVLSVKTSDSVMQFKIQLVPNPTDGENADIDDLMKWLDSKYSKQLNLFGEDTHARTLSMLKATELPVVVLDTRPREAQPEQEADSGSGTSKDVAVSMRYRSSESKDYVVIVYDVTSPRGRFDRYAITVQNSFLLKNLYALYRNRCFGKFLATVQEAVNSKSKLSQLLSFRKLSKSNTQAVCIEPPAQGDYVDVRFVPGWVYEVKAISQSMDGQEYVSLEVQNEDIEHNSKHFVIFNR